MSGYEFLRNTTTFETFTNNHGTRLKLKYRPNVYCLIADIPNLCFSDLELFQAQMELKLIEFIDEGLEHGSIIWLNFESKVLQKDYKVELHPKT